jgi:hypothetical protein
LETVCKHVLDDSGTPYPGDADLPKLWSLAAAVVNLAPAQHQEKVFKEILGNCQSVVNSLGAIRNRGETRTVRGAIRSRPSFVMRS